MLEGGIPFSVVASVMGWSTSTTVRMSRRYGHDRQRRDEPWKPYQKAILKRIGYKIGHSLRAQLRLIVLTDRKVWLPGLDSN
jgi:hypothetical protein